MPWYIIIRLPQAADVPVEFETFFFSEVHAGMSAPLDQVAGSVTRNGVCLKVTSCILSLVIPNSTNLLTYLRVLANFHFFEFCWFVDVADFRELLLLLITRTRVSWSLSTWNWGKLSISTPTSYTSNPGPASNLGMKVWSTTASATLGKIKLTARAATIQSTTRVYRYWCCHHPRADRRWILCLGTWKRTCKLRLNEIFILLIAEAFIVCRTPRFFRT